MSLSRTAAVLVAAVVLAVTGCGTAPDEDPQPTPTGDPQPRAVITEMASDPDETVNMGGTPVRGWWELTVCLLDTAGEPTDDCAQVMVQPEEYAGHKIGDGYPVAESGLLDQRGEGS